MKKHLYIILFAISLFHTSLFAQWIQQTMPVSGQTNDIVFFDQNTGVIALNTTPGMIYRTTDGGFNWIFVNNIRVFRFNKIDNTTVYGNGRNYNVDDVIYRSTNRGLSWDSVSITPASYSSISFVNKDTGWVCGHNGSQGAIWQTTNGGVTLVQQFASGTSGMDRIFFLKEKVFGEYMGWCGQPGYFRKTTNSGLNWLQVGAITASNQIYFINKDTGWIANGGMHITTDGGGAWITQPMPNDASFIFTSMNKFSYVGNGILYGIGGVRFFSGGSGNRGVVWKTTDYGNNWGYQQPDTTINVFVYSVIDFTDSSTGWVYNGSGNKGAHTTTGGGPIIFTAISQISTEVPTNYKLFQNYPNPFNPITNIKYQITKSSYVILKIYDALGRVIKTLVEQNQDAGTYLVDFNASSYSSGIYFYKLTAGNFMETKRMVIIK